MRLFSNAPAAVDLDFAPARRRRPGLLGWVLLAIGLLAAGLAGYDLWTAERDLAEREALVARLRAELRQDRPAQPIRDSAPITAEERAPAERVAGALNADWSAFFTDLADASRPEVALLELQGDAARGSLRMVGESQSVEAAFAYLEQLQRASMLREARIDSHEWVTQGPQMVVRFVLTAQWRPAP
jgi:Tfp pilus assembly protein PilN